VLARHREESSRAAQADLFGSGVQLNAIDAQHAEALQRLRDLDINDLTGIEALRLLAVLKEKTQH
jgi:hypothetical protein